MKKILFFLLLGLTSCCCPDTKRDNTSVYEVNSDNRVFVVTIEHHRYLVFDGHKAGGIIHAESCPCKNQINN